MIEAQVPEFADGGYWYVVPAVPDDLGGITAGIDTPGWCAWYAEIESVTYCAVRTQTAVSGLEPADPVTVAQILGSGEKPFGRIGGY